MTAPPNFDLANWKDHADLLTDSWWQLGARARGEGRDGGKYHGNWVPQIPDQFIRRFTAPGETVLDLFAGSGTTLVEARRLGRHSIGVELQPRVAEKTREHLAKLPNPYYVASIVIAGDSSTREIREQLEPVHHVFLHPPYWDIIPFSSLKGDLSKAKTLEIFLAMMLGVAHNAFEVLAPGRHLTLVCADMYRKGQYIPLAHRCAETVASCGFEWRATIVKDIQGNEKGKGSRSALWRYRAFRHGLFVFRHEYVFHFRRPA